MNNQYLLTGLLVAFSFILNSCSEQPSKKDSMKMFLLNAQHQNRFAGEELRNTPETLWKFKTEGAVVSSPIIVNETVFIGSNDGVLYALDALTGTPLWSFKSGGAINSSPAYAFGKVYFLSLDGSFYALDALDGTIAWQFNTGGESRHLVKDYFNQRFTPDFWDFYLSSPVISEGLVCFGSSDEFVYALDTETGKLQWKFKTSGHVHSSPAVSDNHLVVGSFDSNLYCIDLRTGKEKWIFETGKDTAQYIWLGVQASPSIADNTVYFGSRDAKFYALDLYSGDSLWTKNEFDMSWMPSSAVVDSTTIYTGSSDSFSFFALDRETGNIKYKTPTKAYTFGSPAIGHDLAYIGSANGYLYGIELKTGNIQWEYKTTGIPADTLKMFNSEGLLDGERMQELYRGIRTMPQLSELYTKAFQASGAILSSPSLHEGILYFGSSDSYVYALKNAGK